MVVPTKENDQKLKYHMCFLKIIFKSAINIEEVN